MPTVSGGAYQDARKVSLVWNDNQKLGSRLNPEAACTKRIPQRPFLPYLFRQDGKDRAAGGNGSRKSVATIPQALRASSLYTREPWKCAAGGAAKVSDNLSVSAAPSQLP